MNCLHSFQKKLFQLLFIISIVFVLQSHYNDGGDEMAHFEAQNPSRQKYLAILEMKCNPCHKEKQRSVVFTDQNMAEYANQIKMQVLVKKRMPKGRKYNLTPEEFQIIENWLAPQAL